MKWLDYIDMSDSVRKVDNRCYIIKELPFMLDEQLAGFLHWLRGNPSRQDQADELLRVFIYLSKSRTSTYDAIYKVWLDRTSTQ